ncbi:MAG TPA: hypothetical protein VFB99_06920 [Vicinamibacterales bacterium]|nr:hypothetical protein [Vicinamibacterales bacterium]
MSDANYNRGVGFLVGVMLFAVPLIAWLVFGGHVIFTMEGRGIVFALP